jgi:hypothetical protein
MYACTHAYVCLRYAPIRICPYIWIRKNLRLAINAHHTLSGIWFSLNLVPYVIPPSPCHVHTFQEEEWEEEEEQEEEDDEEEIEKALLGAAEQGDASTVVTLLQAGANPNCTNWVRVCAWVVCVSVCFVVFAIDVHICMYLNIYTCRTLRRGTGMLVHKYVDLQRACVHICKCIAYPYLYLCLCNVYHTNISRSYGIHVLRVCARASVCLSLYVSMSLASWSYKTKRSCYTRSSASGNTGETSTASPHRRASFVHTPPCILGRGRAQQMLMCLFIALTSHALATRPLTPLSRFRTAKPFSTSPNLAMMRSRGRRSRPSLPGTRCWRRPNSAWRSSWRSTSPRAPTSQTATGADERR